MIARVQGRAAFDELRRHGTRVRRGPLAVTYLAGDDGVVRLAFALPRRIGNAVVRNRIRRRLRAVFAQLDPAIVPPGSYLVTADRLAAELPFSQLSDQINQVVAALAARRAS